MQLNPQIFREYDIRGVAGKDLDEGVYELLGKACAAYMKGKTKHRTVVVARDGRLTSKSFSAALIDGITSCGLNVIDIGQVPTPLMYFGLFTLPVDGGVMITASHNPKEYNGMKVAAGNSTIHGSEIQKLGKIAAAGKFPEAKGPVTITRLDLVPKYMKRVLSDIKLKRKLKVVVDAGNGVGGCGGGPVVRKSRMRSHSLVLRRGRQLPEPSSGPDGSEEHHEDDRDGEALKGGLRNWSGRRHGSRGRG